MSRVCQITGKGPLTGNKRSHSLRATRRRWNVNLHTYKVEIDGKVYKVRMSARAYKTLNKSEKNAQEIKRTAIKAVRVAVEKKDLELANTKLVLAFSVIDRSVSKGIQKKGTADRQKSNIQNLVNSLKK